MSQVTAPLANFTTNAPALTDQDALLPYDVKAKPPVSAFYGGVNTPWAIFQRNFIGNYLLAWVEISDGSWGVEARAPLGSWVREFIYVPVSGDLVLNEVAPDGKASKENYGSATPGYKYVWFYADTPGKHSGVFSIGNVKSNEIDITAY